MNDVMTEQVLQLETQTFRDTRGVSANNGTCGFRPAFLDTSTCNVYLSRFVDGRLAPFHLLDGLPDEVVVTRSASGKVQTVKATVVSGFVRSGQFYTREEAAQSVEEIH
jgi:hypothetical protein